ncbi:MAG TPA: MFS transporter [Mobilitalea sp.]|nr:MFS transporter [Mobilitalea sp.]
MKEYGITGWTNSQDNRKKVLVFISFMIIMVVMGASDSLRGVFALVFQNHFKLTTSQVSMIIMVSYIGNLVFLFFGGSFLDRFQKKKVFITVLCIWMSGAVLFIMTDNFIVLLIGMFLCMGASTLINTTINILVPVIFAASPGLIVNVLYFVQGIGTSGSQNAIGSLTMSFTSWKLVNMILITLAVLGAIFLFINEIPDVKQKDKKKVTYGSIIKTPAFVFFTLIFGFYFIAEHGILNWLIIYGTNELGFTTAKAARYLSIFFGGITIGRFVFAPAVQKLGVAKSIGIFGCVGMVFYVLGIIFSSKAIILLSLSGFSISIVYPTLVLMIRNFYENDRIATATGAVISLATIYDICFNAVFGKLIDNFGLRTSFYILPASMLIFCVLFLIFCKTVKPVKKA